MPANAVCQRHLRHLTQRVRQQAGSYRSSLARHFAVRLLPSRLKPVPHTADAFPAEAGPTYGGCGGSGRAEAGSAPACGVSGCTRTDCRSALARECGVSAPFRSPDPARSPANRLRQMSACHQCCSAAPDASRLKPLFKHPTPLPSASLSPRGEWRWPGARLPWLRRNPFRCRHSLAAPESIHGLPAL